MNKYNIWNRWDPLKAVMIGSLPPASAMDFIEDANARSTIQRIIEESERDLEYYEKVLKQSGAEVIRCDDFDQNIYEKVFEQSLREGRKRIPKPSVTPRDRHIVLGNKLYSMIPRGNGSPFNKFEHNTLDRYNSVDRVNLTEQSIDCTIHPPQLTLVGKDLYVDVNGMDPLYEEANKLGMHPVDMMEKFLHDMTLHVNIIKKMNPDLRIHKLNIGGHNDGSFITFGEGKILSNNYIQDYEKTFPFWRQHAITGDPSVNKLYDWVNFRNKSHGKFYIEGANDNFITFANEWLNDWVGFVEESYFDVNLFMIDDRTMCVTNPNHPTIRAIAKKYKIELVHVPWKHMFFWDGGLHCLTLDLNREGEMEDYFPDRDDDEEITDNGYDVEDPYKLFIKSMPKQYQEKIAARVNNIQK